MTTTRPLRTLALATVLALALLGCGDDGGDDEQTSASTEGPTATTTDEAATSTEDTTATTAADGLPALCDALTADAVATAGGVEVVGTQPSTGTGSLDDVEYASEGCTYELADGGRVRVRALTDPAGAPFTADDFAALQATSAGRDGSDDHPHEDIADLGAGAFFQASLLGNELYVDAGSVVLLVDGDVADGPMSRDAVRAVAAEAVTAVG